jgi:hypothetical protein
MVKASPALYVLVGWPSDLVLQRPLEDIHDLFARVGVLDERRFRAEVDARLDDLVAVDTEVVPLEIGAPESRRLLDRHDLPLH